MSRFHPRLWQRIPPGVLALTSSVLLSFALRPWGLGVLALLAFVPLAFALHLETKAIRAALWTYVCAIGGTFVALEGLATHFPFVFVTGVLAYSVAFALIGPLVILLKARFQARALWVLPVAWIAIEYLVSQRWLFGIWANPIMVAGYTQFDTPLIHAARWSGATGVSFLVLGLNLAITWLILHRRWQPLAGLLAVAALSVGAPAPGAIPTGQPFKAGIAQGHFNDLEYTIADFDQNSRNEIANRYKTMLEKLALENPSIVVLPETMFGGWNSDLATNSFIRDTLEPIPLALVGVKVLYETEGHNAILEYQREAQRLREVYAKQIPIPLTEGGYKPGQNLGLVRLGGVLFGLAICWENTFPGLARDTINAGAQVMVYQNNLTWAGRTATPVLHQHISAFRAVETGRDVIHATAGGPSAIIRADGRIISAAPQSLETTLTGMVQPRVGRTPYLMFGDWIGMLCAFGLAVLLVLSLVIGGSTRAKSRLG